MRRLNPAPNGKNQSPNSRALSIRENEGCQTPSAQSRTGQREHVSKSLRKGEGYQGLDTPNENTHFPKGSNGMQRLRTGKRG